MHATRLEEDAGCSGVLGMSRHAWEVEQSLYRGSNGHHLQHLTTLSKTRSHDVAYCIVLLMHLLQARPVAVGEQQHILHSKCAIHYQ